MLIITQERPLRCPEWEDYTPNEAMEIYPPYRRALKKWALESDIPWTDRLVEVRVTKQESRFKMNRSSRWWDDPLWMDKLFWIFHKPIQLFPYGNEPMSCYALEFFECQRILRSAVDKFGYNPFTRINEQGELESDWQPSLFIPCECVEIAWTDTQGGYATNIREGAVLRANEEKSSYEQDLEASIEEQIREKTKEIYDPGDSFNVSSRASLRGTAIDDDM